MKKVMVVDDSDEVRQTIVTYLSELQGYEISGYYTEVNEAIANLKVNRPDIIISSILTLGMTGFMFAEILKVIEPSIPIILMSEDKKHALQSYEKGFLEFLEKPINKEKFNKVIQRIH